MGTRSEAHHAPPGRYLAPKAWLVLDVTQAASRSGAWSTKPPT